MFFSNRTIAHDAVFYCTYQNDKCVESSKPVKIRKSNIDSLMKDVVSGEKNFVGFIDKSDTTIQFYVDEIGSVWVEIIALDEKGSYGKHISNDEFYKIVKGLNEPYAKYKEELNLQFKAW